jgi:hypothetical protein
MTVSQDLILETIAKLMAEYKFQSRISVSKHGAPPVLCFDFPNSKAQHMVMKIDLRKDGWKYWVKNTEYFIDVHVKMSYCHRYNYGFKLVNVHASDYANRYEIKRFIDAALDVVNIANKKQFDYERDEDNRKFKRLFKGYL